MAINCKNCPLRRLDLFQNLSPEETTFMDKFKMGELTVDPGTPILMEGSNSPQLFTALRGMGLRYKMLENGNRHVVNFVFPGDFIGLQAGIMGEMGHSVEATSPMTLCVFDRGAIWNLFKNHPERAFDLTWMSAIEEHFLGEAVSTIGQRSATESIAWALTRIFLRGRAQNMTTDNRMRLPYRQQDLADALGLSLVHTNKTLAALRKRQLARWSDGVLTVNDIDALAAIAGIEVDKIKTRALL